MAKVGRPKLWDDKQIEEIKEMLSEYIESNDIPIIAEFAYQNKLSRQSLYDQKEFSTLLKRCIDKKEAQLERLGLSSAIEKSMAIFSLKQLGWSDKQEVKTSGEEVIKVKFEDDIEEDDGDI